MSKSLSIPLFVTLLGTIAYAVMQRGRAVSLVDRDYVMFAVDLFNVSVIVALFCILYSHEKKDDSTFGKAIRDNISTIVLSLLINVVTSSVNVASKFLDKSP